MGSRRLLAGWAIVWAPVLVLAALRLAIGEAGDAARLAGDVAVAFAGAAAYVAAPRFARRTIVVLLVAITAYGAAEYVARRTAWSTSEQRGMLEAFDATSVTVRGVASRQWRLPDEAEEVVLVARASLHGDPATSWFPSDRRITIESLDAHTSIVRFPPQRDPYVERTVDAGAPLGGRRVRASAELHTELAVPGTCAGLRLQVRGPPDRHACSADRLTGGWVRQSVEWDVPAGVDASTLHVVVNDLNGRTVGVRDARAEMWDRDRSRWIALEPLLPTVPYVTLTWDGDARSSGSTPLEIARASAAVEVRAAVPAFGPQIVEARVVAFPDGTGTLRLEDVRLHVLADGAILEPTPHPRAWGENTFGLGHPNLAAHALLAIGGAASVMVPGFIWIGVPVLGATILATQSRSGMLGLSVFVLTTILGRWVRLRSGPTRTRSGPLPSGGPMASATVVVLAVAVLVAVPLWQRTEGNPTRRTEIWNTTFQAIQNHPWRGLGSGVEPFRTFWERTYAGSSREPVMHAHNVVLRYGAAYGIPGLLAILATLALWATWMVRSRDPRGMGLLVGLLVANAFDDTLFFAWVLPAAAAASAAVRYLPRPSRDAGAPLREGRP